MTLRLSVVSEHGIRLGAHSTKVFGVHGGSIGRGTDNEWILPDPERYLSGKHARVDFRAGTYVLVDTSSNGTYVNGSQVPLGKYHDYTLKDGDYVRLGEYELLVSIDKSNDFPPDQSAIVAYDGQAPSSNVRKSTANDLGADLDLSQLLEPSDELRSAPGVQARNSYGQAVAAPPVAPPHAAAPAGPPPLEDEISGTPWHMMTRPLKVEPKAAPAPTAPAPPRQTVPALYEGDLDIGLSAFCRGAGVDPPHHHAGSAWRRLAARRSALARVGARPHGLESRAQRIPKSLSHPHPGGRKCRGCTQLLAGRGRSLDSAPHQSLDASRPGGGHSR